VIPDLLRGVTEAAARSVDPAADVDPLVPTGNPAHGDYQWNFAFRTAKTLRTNPRALAEKLKPLLQHPAIARVEVAGPGFLNLVLDDAWLATTVARQLEAPALGIPRLGDGATVVIDYSSPNVAKRMHVGHMRSTHIGHALDRLHRAAGYTVVADNHIGDWGTQFGQLIVARRRWLDAAAFADDPVGELERLYVRFRKEADADPALEDEARAETVKLQQGDPENTTLWREFLRVSLAEFDAVYARMGVGFDEMLGESAYRDRVDGLVAELLASGVAERSEGAVIVRFDSPELRDHVMIVQKKDGAANYATTDLACLRYRMERWNPARIVYVTDGRQQLHFQQLFALGRRIGITTDLVHAWFGTLTLPEGAMSTRRGNVIRLVDLLDEAVRRARAVVDEKSPELDDPTRAAIAEAVGVGAVRYADLSQNPQSNVTFSWDRMLAMDGNTAPYLLYSHARCVSLLAKAGEPPDLGRLQPAHALERDLVLTLARYPEAVTAALRTYRPNVLADHLFETANRFHRFYHELSVLQGGEARAPRLALVEGARRVLRHGLDLLGLRVLDRM
jgi:arginyl-tRNA synthetase